MKQRYFSTYGDNFIKWWYIHHYWYYCHISLYMCTSILSFVTICLISVCLQTISLYTNCSTRHNDIALNMDTGKIIALRLLYLSADFDTIDFSVLLDCISDLYGISGISLTWIRSFLIYSFQSIKIRKWFSKTVPLFRDVPQSSVLGLLLFTLYTTRLSSLIHSHKDHHLYADDIQAYISLFTADTELSLIKLG